jgi:hypothetical protein
LLRKAKKGSMVWAGGGSAKNAEMREKTLRFEEGLKEKVSYDHRE